MVRKALVFLLLSSVFLPAPGAHAAEVTRVLSGSRAKGELFDMSLTASWLREDKTAIIKREFEAASTGGDTTVIRDLIYRQSRNLLNLRADTGLFRNISAFVVAPLVLSDDRSLSFDRRSDGCQMMGATAFTPDCVNEVNSTFLRDGIQDKVGGEFGWDATHNRRFSSPSEMVFRGPTRKGLEYLSIGLGWAVFNQQTDDTKPTWIVRLESRFSVAEDMRFDREKSSANTGVGLGYHQYVLSTMFSKRFDWFDPYLGGWYMLPSTTSGSIYKQYPLGRNGFGGPQHRVGADFGVEGIIWEQPREQQRVTLELRGRLEMRSFGLAQGELWEPLSGRSTCPMDPLACRKDIDWDLNQDGKVEPSNGVTRSPSYGLFGGDAGLNVQVGRYVRFRGLFGLTWEQDRFLTDGRSGNDATDATGRRFRVEDARLWHVMLEGGLLF